MLALSFWLSNKAVNKDKKNPQLFVKDLLIAASGYYLYIFCVNSSRPM